MSEYHNLLGDMLQGHVECHSFSSSGLLTHDIKSDAWICLLPSGCNINGRISTGRVDQEQINMIERVLLIDYVIQLLDY